MIRVAAAILLLLGLAACSDSETPAPAASEAPAAAEPAPAEPSAKTGEPSPAEILAGGMEYTIGPDGARGCKDKAEAEALVAASKKEDPAEMIELWAAGMQDQSCRGFTSGLGVTVEKMNEGGWDCIVSIDTEGDKTCVWIESGLIKKNDVN